MAGSRKEKWRVTTKSHVFRLSRWTSYLPSYAGRLGFKKKKA